MSIRLHSDKPVVANKPDRADGMVHASEPRLALLPSNSLLLTYRIGSARTSPDGTIQLASSHNGGTSWIERSQPFGKQFGGRTGDLLSAPLTALASGRLVAAITWLDRHEPASPWRNTTTDGRRPVEMLATISDDSGISWSRPARVDVTPMRQASPQVVYQLKSGMVIATFETFKEYDDASQWDYRVGVVASADNGNTWSPAWSIAKVDEQGTMWWDPRVTQLADGRLVQFFHAINYPSGTDLPVHVAFSEDDGRTWTSPTPTSIQGQHSWPVALSGGELVVLVVQRHHPQGIRAYLSKDGGRTFDPGDATWVHRQSNPSAGPADGSSTTLEYFDEIEKFTFGHPTGIAMTGDSLLIAYYTGDRKRTSIYTSLLELTDR